MKSRFRDCAPALSRVQIVFVVATWTILYIIAHECRRRRRRFRRRHGVGRKCACACVCVLLCMFLSITLPAHAYERNKCSSIEKESKSGRFIRYVAAHEEEGFRGLCVFARARSSHLCTPAISFHSTPITPLHNISCALEANRHHHCCCRHDRRVFIYNYYSHARAHARLPCTMTHLRGTKMIIATYRAGTVVREGGELV